MQNIVQFPSDVLKIILNLLGNRSCFNFSLTCKSIYHLSQKDLNQRRYERLIEIELDLEALTLKTGIYSIYTLYVEAKNMALSFTSNHEIFRSEYMPFYSKFESKMTYKRDKSTLIQIVNLLRHCIKLQSSEMVRNFLRHCFSFY